MDFRKWLISEGLTFKDKIHLFRGIGKPNSMDRIGKWWTTSPYYAIKYGNSKVGQIFVATITKQELNQGLADGSIVDVTQDEYPNYAFKKFDPPKARPMSKEELTQFKILSGALDQNGQPKDNNTPVITAAMVQNSETPMLPMSTSKWLNGQEAIDATYQVYG